MIMSFLRLTRVKTASALFWDSPYHLSTIEEILKLINLAPKRQTGQYKNDEIEKNTPLGKEEAHSYLSNM